MLLLPPRLAAVGDEDEEREELEEEGEEAVAVLQEEADQVGWKNLYPPTSASP